MSDLLDTDASDGEDFIAAWLQPVIRAAAERDSDDELPFCQVQIIDDDDDQCEGFSEQVIQLDVFGRGIAEANAAKKTVRRRMNELARELETVTLSDDSDASPNFVECRLGFTRLPYKDEQIVRYTSRWGVGLPYVAVS